MSDDGLNGRLRLEPGCLRLRTWRLDLPRTLSAAALSSELQALGWSDESRFSALRQLRHPDGHHVLVVPETGRVQIRIDLGVAETHREGTAKDVARAVLAAAQRVEESAQRLGT